MPAVRQTIIFRGRVQGVGFRWTTRRIAGGFNITGCVRNEPDGSVKCVVEGEAAEIANFIEDVRRAMEGNISEVQTTASTPTGEFATFRIHR